MAEITVPGGSMKLISEIDCMICEGEARARGEIGILDQRFPNYCPECGCKRCPKSTWHGNPCTHSNEPGQPGSFYGVAPYKLDEGDEPRDSEFEEGGNE